MGTEESPVRDADAKAGFSIEEKEEVDDRTRRAGS